MSSQSLVIRRAAVLGSGVMGAQIAAHLANADIPVILFDLAAKEGDPNGIVRKAVEGLKKLQPAPLVTRDRLAAIDVGNYDQHLDRLRDCDLVIEAISEKIEWKVDLYAKIIPYLKDRAIVASNTSGISINQLSEAFPAARRPLFCGVHFFNPPRYMQLVEVIPSATTDAAMLDALESWLVKRMGKGVVRAKDTPSFVANRVGLFSILAVMHHTEQFKLGFDEVDALTGPRIGRPKSATYRTADVIGLDTLAHVTDSQQETLPDDPWREYFKAPAWLTALMAKGALGQKAGGGIFRKAGREIQVLDLGSGDYRASTGGVAPEVDQILKNRNAAERFAALRASSHPQAQFLWAMFRDVFHYCAYHLAGIADNARDVDFAMRWGYGWAQGPFEIWQTAGWKAIAEYIAEDIAAGKAMSKVPLPAWVAARDDVHRAEGSYSAAEDALKPRSTLPVYARQLFPDLIVGERHDRGETLEEDDSVRIWRMPKLDSRIAILSFKSKMHSLGKGVVEGIYRAVALAEADFDGLVIAHEAPFAVGANLVEVMQLVKAGQWDELDKVVAHFQGATKALRFAQVPTVAAVDGMAFGGGAEVAMHCAHRVMALETYIGLVEAGVGLIPAGGGCKELARRASEAAMRRGRQDPWEEIQKAFGFIIRGMTSKNAIDAKAMGFAAESDTVLFNARELPYAAIRQARAMFEGAYRPPLPAKAIKVIGRPGNATLHMDLVNLREGGFMSEHDYIVSEASALVLCGGDVEPGTLVDEDWLLDIERRQFVELLKTEKTQQRMTYMLESGKPLRN
ncbi:3-hydroxyacyl-CoA dehydrogenase/enoyl-CoA hydratase family protein [Accumulibacter sp.]|uniref:3-hydroxyacyl-CoA dehydrogenase/enoyl-CoA hydratase family protein n=1 Tax=Accumulibacter sp. TaxID=2053492 RepID=UPI002637D48A|nr:3-hydroxyacyl-CoA dehydrogenase/enoyl-CoA hydratase family protein [Accumulibacter sp.]